MAYSKQNFQNGQILNAANLEAMENGIIAGQGAHNLLDNSDFRNPVNQRGRSGTYEGVSNYTTFVIDRWKTWSTGCTYTLSSAGMQIANLNASSSAGPWEVLPNPERMKGKTYTLAVGYNGGNVACGNVAVPTGTLTEDKYLSAVSTSGTRPGVRFVIASNYSSIDFQILILDGQTVTVEWAALYEGAYTADTLPAYVPKGKHVEMLNCGVSLVPYNLLDNSDFTNPVNQRGATTAATLGKYFIDRWDTEPFPSGPSITIDSNGLTLLPTTSSTAGIYQILPDYENRKGKVHTFAICVNDVWKCVSFTMGNFGVGYFIHGLAFFSVDNRNILIRNNASDTPAPITIQRVALYEGAYTADTLPAYVPKGKHVEMLNCNVPLAPHNLLDNSYFRNPVNQRGIANSATIERYTYFLDRWSTGDTAGTITLNSNGLIFNVLISQRIDPAILRTGTAVTAAAKFSDGTLVIVSGVVNLSTSWHWLSSPVVNGCQIGLVDGTSNGIPYVRIGNENGKTLVWAALYEGSYTADTLPAYQPKGYAAELAECQRYYRQMSYPVIPCGNNPAGTQVYGFLPFRMRIDSPTVSCDSLHYFKGDTTFYTVSSASAATYGAGTRIVFNLSQSVEENLAGAIAGNGITISADL